MEQGEECVSLASVYRLLTMLTSGYSFREEPFRLSPDLHVPYQSFAFQETYGQLRAAVLERRGPVLLSGESGTGKTLLLRVLKRELDAVGAWVCFPSLVQATKQELLTACSEGAGLITEPMASLETQIAALTDFLKGRLAADRLAALFVDDVQDLSDELLQTLERLWRLEERGRRLLPVILAGQPDVAHRVQEALRVGAEGPVTEASLHPLEAWELRPFILHQLRGVGYGGNNLFSEEAYVLIQKRSKGIPRRINLLCGTAVMLAGLEGRDRVTADDVRQALRDNWLDDDRTDSTGLRRSAQVGLSQPGEQITLLTPGPTRVGPYQRSLTDPVGKAVTTIHSEPTLAQPLVSRLHFGDKAPSAPTVVNKVVPECTGRSDDAAQMAISAIRETRPTRTKPYIAAGGETRADNRDGSAVRGSRWRWVAKPVLASIGLAGGVLVGGAVMVRYPALLDTLKDRFVSGLLAPAERAATGDGERVTVVSTPSTGSAESEETLATAYSNLAIVYQTRGDLERAEEMHHKALAIHKALGQRASMARDYNNLGYVYWFRGDLERAEDVYGKSLQLHEALGQPAGMADNYANLGSVYWTRGDLHQAETMYRQALTLNMNLNRQEKLANNYGNLGVVYQTRGDLKQAQAMHRKAIAIYEALGRQTEGLANAYGNLGSVFKRSGDLAHAEAMYRKALNLYQKVGNQEQANRAQALISALRDPDAAGPPPVGGTTAGTGRL